MRGQACMSCRYFAPAGDATGPEGIERGGELLRVPVVGHPFCHRLAPAVPVGTVAAMTPVYLTDGEFGRISSELLSLSRRGRLATVFLRDLGLLTWAVKRLPAVQSIWDRWAWGRDGTVSSALLDTLRDLGAAGIEVDVARADDELLDRLRARGLVGVAALGGRPVSFSPRCYTERLLGVTCGERPLCRGAAIEVKSLATTYRATGHVLTAPRLDGAPPTGWDLSR